MNYDIVSYDTKKKIIDIIPKNTYIHKDSISHKILKKIPFRNITSNKSTILSILYSKNMITKNYSEVTPLGKAILLTQVFDVSLLSIFVLVRIWQIQRLNPKKMFCTTPTLERLLSMYKEVTIAYRLKMLRKKDFLLSSNKRKSLKITPSIFLELESREAVMNEIIEYINDMDSKIQNLIEIDLCVINNKKKIESIWK